MRCPKIHFKQNVSLFDKNYDDYSLGNNNKNFYKATTVQSQHLSKRSFQKCKSHQIQTSVYDISSDSSDDEMNRKKKKKKR
jgi:hypothetical protein